MTGSALDTGGGTAAGQEPVIPPVPRYRYRESVKVILVTVFLAIVLKTFVVEAYRIPSGSMENTLLVGDYLIVNKLAFGFRTPGHIPFTNIPLSAFRFPLFRQVHRGDVVVFEYPGPYSEVHPSVTVDYVKRSIGLPGDTVRIVHGTVIVNGRTLDLPPLAKSLTAEETYYSEQRATTFPPGTEFTQYDYGPIIVPKKNDTLTLDAENIKKWKTLIEREGHSVLVDDEANVYIDGLRSDCYVVSRNYYFMLGDNRDNSLDSRYWGFVPSDNIVGEALLVYWSWNTDSADGTVTAGAGSIRWNRIGTLIR